MEELAEIVITSVVLVVVVAPPIMAAMWEQVVVATLEGIVPLGPSQEVAAHSIVESIRKISLGLILDTEEL